MYVLDERLYMHDLDADDEDYIRSSGEQLSSIESVRLLPHEKGT